MSQKKQTINVLKRRQFSSETGYQSVVIDAKFSNPMPFKSSIMEGGTCSPLLFCIFIQSLASQMSETGLHFWMFADDVKLCSHDPHKLQLALDVVSNWIDNWQLLLSPTKCFYPTNWPSTQAKRSRIYH